MLKVVFGVNVNEISLGMPGTRTMYVSVAPFALVGAVCWTCSQSTSAYLIMWLRSLSIQATCLISFFVAHPEHVAVSSHSTRVCSLSTHLCVCAHVLFHLTVSSCATEHRFYFLICNCRKGASGTELFLFSFFLVLCAASLWSLLHCLQAEQKKAEEGGFLLLCRR